MVEQFPQIGFTPPLRQLAILGGITSDFSLWIDTFEQFAGWLVIRVLRYKFAVNGEVEDFGLCLNNCFLQIRFSTFNNIYKQHPTLNL